MTATFESARARRYLLGAASETESSRIEEDYLSDDDAVERISAVEDELIEEYLQNELPVADRERFERTYLASPRHRLRLETVRRLRARAAQAASPQTSAAQPVHRDSPATRTSRWRPFLALAASAVLATGAFWTWSSVSRRENVASGPAPVSNAPDVAPARRMPALLAMTLSPTAVRGAAAADASIVPPEIEVLAIRLEGDGEARRLAAARAVLRTVSGREVWQGRASAPSDRSGAVVAELEVPAAALAADDYLLTLFGTDNAGREQEWQQYFIRLRRP